MFGAPRHLASLSNVVTISRSTQHQRIVDIVLGRQKVMPPVASAHPYETEAARRVTPRETLDTPGKPAL
jgi:hypothetical protein